MRIVTATIPTTHITAGMTIVEWPAGRGKPTEIKVKEVKHSACSSRNTHVNGNLCYDRSGQVQIRTGMEKSPDEMTFEELSRYLGVEVTTPEERLLATVFHALAASEDEVPVG